MLLSTSPELDAAERPRGAPALSALSASFTAWLRLRALPLWATLGAQDDGLFAEALTPSGDARNDIRRARVQARQIHVFATAAELGWPGPWLRTAQDGLRGLISRYLRQDGLMRSLLDGAGRSINGDALLYDQCFLLLATATLMRCGADAETCHALGATVRHHLLSARRNEGGWEENSADPFQANAHMHLLEACLAWEAIDPVNEWPALADDVVQLAIDRFIDPADGALREFFDRDWRVAGERQAQTIEPGHQFEWAWLLLKWGTRRGDSGVVAIAEGLYRAGRCGLDARRGVIVDELDGTLAVRSARARLWPQTEWLKAALAFGDIRSGERDIYRDDAAIALGAIWLYLEPTGLWKDKLLPSGAFVSEPSPASTLYHLMGAYQQLAESMPATGGQG